MNTKLKTEKKFIRVMYLHDEDEGLYTFFAEVLGGPMIVAKSFEEGKRNMERALKSAMAMMDIHLFTELRHFDDTVTSIPQKSRPIKYDQRPFAFQ